MKLCLVLLSSLTSLSFSALISSSFNPCAMEPHIMESLIECSNPRNPKAAQELWTKRTGFIPGMKATDLIYEVCRINNNAGYTLWTQFMNELEPDVAVIVDKHTYECLKKYNLAL